MRFSKTWLRIIFGVSAAVWLSIAGLSLYRFYFKRKIFNETPVQDGLMVELNCKSRGTSTATLERKHVRYKVFFQNKHCTTLNVGDVVGFHELPESGYALLADENIVNDFYYGLAFLGLACGSSFFLFRTFRSNATRAI